MTLLCRGAMSKILHYPWIVANINMASKNTNLFGFRILYAQFGKERLPFSSMARNQPKDKRFTRSEQSISTPFMDKHWTISDRSVVKIQKEVKLPLTDLQEKVKSSAVILGELCGLDVEDVGHMVCKRPRILLLDDQQIKHCIKTLRNVGLKELNIATMLKKSPGILTSRIENCLEEKARHDCGIELFSGGLIPGEWGRTICAPSKCQEYAAPKFKKNFGQADIQNFLLWSPLTLWDGLAPFNYICVCLGQQIVTLLQLSFTIFSYSLKCYIILKCILHFLSKMF